MWLYNKNKVFFHNLQVMAVLVLGKMIFKHKIQFKREWFIVKIMYTNADT